MKYKHVIWIVVLVLVADQALKFWVKTHMSMDQEFIIFPNWFRIHFLENPGMAYGLEFGGNFGKILLTLFRLIAVVLGFKLMSNLVKSSYSNGLLIFGSLILAGAAGNLIDSMFYGMLFSDSNYYQVAQFLPKGGGYGSFLHGRVVDMLYFHLYDDTLPAWVPFSGGKHFIFFAPIFNIADASISVGVIAILLFQKKLLHKKDSAPEETVVATPEQTA
ncbi:signal peptidase II Aspartic peptidase. MEROPS family A08 [Chitinophaga costaii]|uniref:Lipoprotein signal peptidase n=1 Tax=Chitinophaga costaii TaxID=1335309 RepID=A0A1C4DRD6_9BACT|nr:lipoprotein signal peptidase [Chitinophaga costaii]PUZ27747.1 lipoprotein signal peptidase [Chitinophaga costaii]SCC33785.1 signal peptidase II Aspartic peptidase. MEROPS family A08 [Chitinophaga costaii]